MSRYKYIAYIFVFFSLIFCISGCDSSKEESVQAMAKPIQEVSQAENNEDPEEINEPEKNQSDNFNNNSNSEETTNSKSEETTESKEVYTSVNNEEKEIIDSNGSNEKKDSNKEIVKSEKEDIEPSTQAPKMPSENSSLVGYNDSKSWWFKRNSDHIPPSAQQDINITQYDAYYLGDTSKKVIYLTFDEGYENGYTTQILDVLAKNDVKAAFFVTKPYIESQPELVKRMVDEGHIVGNHSVNHYNMPEVSDENFAQELLGCAEAYENLIGEKMPLYFRPPAGVYSIRSLEKTKELGYKTIFWSYAYKDWDTKNQPSIQEAYDMALNNYHNGSIMLLHAVSQANTEALDSIINSLKERGYIFATLDELP